MFSENMGLEHNQPDVSSATCHEEHEANGVSSFADMQEEPTERIRLAVVRLDEWMDLKKRNGEDVEDLKMQGSALDGEEGTVVLPSSSTKS